MFLRRRTGISVSDMNGVLDIASRVTEIREDMAALKAENKALREDRDTWKAMALKLADRGDPGSGAGDSK